MKESEDSYIEELIGKVMKHSTLETPYFNFSSDVMAKVENIKLSSHTTYKPLISKRAWLMVFGIFVIFVVYIIWFGKPESSAWINVLDFNFLNANKLSNFFNDIKLSKTVRSSILMFSIMLIIQIPLLKYYLNKRIVRF